MFANPPYSTQSVVLASKKDIRIVGYAMSDKVRACAGKQGLLNVLTTEKVIISL